MSATSDVLPNPYQAFLEAVCQEAGQTLWSPMDLQAERPAAVESAEDNRALQEANQWVHEFIMRPHPAMGRPGPVCPYVKTAIDQFLLYYTVARMNDPASSQEIEGELDRLATLFLKMPVLPEHEAALKCFIVLFPHTPEKVFNNPPQLGRLKTGLLKRDVMVGQFFPSSEPQTALKAKFFPMQPPFPIYVIRGFIETDWAFIQGEAEWRKIYIQRFGSPLATETVGKSEA